MSNINHITGGIVFTSIFTSLWNLNIISNPWYIISTIFFSILPDVDHPKSIIGKIFFPISKYLDTNYGHRTITHGFLFLVITTFVTYIIEKTLLKSINYTIIAFFSYLSHLLLDMMTIQGIPFLYPFKRNPCVLPANPELRFKSGDFHNETIIFCFLIILGFTCKDLLKNGFWTSYNKAFGSIMHIAREFKRSTKLIKVHFNCSINGKIKFGEGYVIAAEKENVYIFTTDIEVIKIPHSAIFYHLDFEITKKDFITEDKHFYSISLEQLYKLIAGKPLIQLKLNCNSDFILNHKEAISNRNINLNYTINPQLSINNQFKEQRKNELKTINQEITALKKKKDELYIFISQIKQSLKTKNLYERENSTKILKNHVKEIEKIDKILIPQLEQKKIIILKNINEKVEINGYMTYVKL